MEAQIIFPENSSSATIQVNGEEQYYTMGKDQIFKQILSLYSKTDKRLVLTSQFTAIPFRVKIIFEGGQEVRVKPKDAQALVYTCQYGKDMYEIYQHKDRKHSVYKNERMMAYFDKSEFAQHGNDSYYLLADDGSDIELLLGFTLALHFFHKSGSKFENSRDLGNIWEKRPFNQIWKPLKS
jgi:hypothetical protein